MKCMKNFILTLNKSFLVNENAAIPPKMMPKTIVVTAVNHDCIPKNAENCVGLLLFNS